MKRIKLTLLIIVLSATCVFADVERKGKTELYLFQSQGKVEFETNLPGYEMCGPDRVNTNYDILGLGLAHFETEQLAWKFEYSQGDSTVRTVDRIGLPLTADVEQWTFTAGIEYYLWPKKTVTPYISAGIGITNATAKRNPCQHNSSFHILNDDYYVCEIGTGLRWDLNKNLFTKIEYRYRSSIIGERLESHYAIIGIGIKF